MPLDEKGWEQLDPNPIAKPLKWDRPGSTLAEIRRNLDARMALISREAAEQGYETLEESQDFDVGDDDFDPLTLHELRAAGAEMSPVELYEAVFKKSYQPPAPVVPGTATSGVSPGASGDNPSVANSPITPSTSGQ